MNILEFDKEMKPVKFPDDAEGTQDSKNGKLYELLSKYSDGKKDLVLSIILPVYNEERSIFKLLCDLPNNNNIEIIVVDDNSTDNSVKEIKKIQEEVNLILIRHKSNRGYGGAIVTGVQQAHGDVIVTMDSDGQHRPEDIISVIKPVLEDRADYTIGSRYLGSNNYELPLVTRVGEAVVEKFIQIFFNQKIMNNQNGFRAFNRKVLNSFHDFHFYGFTFATEIILKLISKNFRIKECPIQVYHRQFGSSKINLKKLTLNLFSCLLLYYFKKIKFHLFKR